MLAEAIAGTAGEHPDVNVRPIVLFDPKPAAALIKAGRRAGLVVVGRWGRSGLAHRLLGSVTDVLVGRAQCPVVVVGCPGESTATVPRTRPAGSVDTDGRAIGP